MCFIASVKYFTAISRFPETAYWLAITIEEKMELGRRFMTKPFLEKNSSHAPANSMLLVIKSFALTVSSDFSSISIYRNDNLNVMEIRQELVASTKWFKSIMVI